MTAAQAAAGVVARPPLTTCRSSSSTRPGGARRASQARPRPTAELFRAVDGELRPVSPDPEGGLRSDVLGVHLRTVDGQLRITWSTGSAAV